METSSLTFASPAWFFALLAVPVIAGLYAWAWRRNDQLISKIVAVRLRAQLAGAVSRGRRLFKALLVLVIMAFAIVALARPQWGYIEREVKQRGRDIILAVDTSRSMLATDVPPTRLARAKLVAQDLLKLVQGDRVGLIAFAGTAFLQAPLTLDQNAVLTSLDDLDTTVIPKGGTNIAAAIQQAMEAFGKGEGQTRALVILTDGEELDADGIAAAKKAAAEGVRIFTVGIGSGEGSLIPLKGEDGASDFVRDASGKPVRSRLDETRLKEIAEAGGGFYEPLSAEVARTIFDKGILPMELRDTGEMTSRQPIERYQWPLGFASALLALWLMIGDRRRNVSATSPVRKAVTASAALVLLSASLSQAATGYEAYQAGDYKKAMEDFQARLKDAPDSAKLQFDAGAASYKLGDFPSAVEYFTKALLAEDKKMREDASYNLGNALVRRGEAAQGNDEKKSDWKNAIQHYTEALNIQPKNKRAEENREIVKKMLEDLEKQEQEKKKDEQKKDDQKQDQKDQKDQKDQQKQDQKDQNKDQKKDDQQQKQDQKNQQDQNKPQDQQDQNKSDNKQDQNQQNPQDQQNKDQKGQNDPNKKDEKKKDQDKQQNQDKQNQGKDEEKKDQPKESDQQQGEQKQEPQMAQNEPKDGGKDQKEPAPQPTPGEKKEGDLKANQQPQPASEGGEEQAEAEVPEKEGEMSAAQARALLNSLRGEEGRPRTKRPDIQDTLKDW